MLRRRGNDRGLAEIVGTLMLVLIVVSAAVVFAAFVQSYQAQLQASEAATHLQSLESLHVLSVYGATTPVTGTGVVATSFSPSTQSITTTPQTLTGTVTITLPASYSTSPTADPVTSVDVSYAPVAGDTYAAATITGQTVTGLSDTVSFSQVYTAAAGNVPETVTVASATADYSYAGSPAFATLTVTITSGDVNPMWVQDFLINGVPVISYQALYLENGTQIGVGVIPTYGGTVNDANSTLFIPARQQVAITLQLNPLLSFQSPNEIPAANSYLVLDFYTTRGSSFTAVFVPPTALADITYTQSTSDSDTIVENPTLDGSHSFQQGGNATIVAWEWAITDEGPTGSGTTYESGAEVELQDSSLNPLDTYEATLTVYNSVGLFDASLTVSFGPES